jgi:ribulose-5-phosphate 4-epimerase/fuculose-1-phosphate aldolase
MCTSDHGNHPIAVDVVDTAAASVAPSPEIVEELVAANHILFDQGVVDAFGKRPDRFLLARNMAPSRVAGEDIVEFTLDGEAVNANGRKVYLERFIHAEIFRKRPDVMAVIHSHSHSIVPLSVVKGTRLRAMFHMAGFVGQGAPVFEIREAGGDATDLLISSNHLGRALAEHFDGHDIVLMRGHGSTVVGGSIKQAVYRAVYAELNARYQLQAMQLGEVTYLTEGESRACVASIEAQVHRPWEMWLEQARARRR